MHQNEIKRHNETNKTNIIEITRCILMRTNNSTIGLSNIAIITEIINGIKIFPVRYNNAIKANNPTTQIVNLR
jgi:hypothetical protein